MSDPVARILALLQAGDFAAAATLAAGEIARGATHPLFFDVRGSRLAQAGQYEAALADFTRALTFAPTNPALHISSARCLIALDRWPEAMAACDRAIALEPRFAAAHYDKGCAAEMLGDLDLARRCYTHAQTLDPAMSGAPARLAALAARRGDNAQAKALAQKSLALEPGNSIATLALATAGLGAGETAGLEIRLNTILSDASLPAPVRANASSLLGDVYDREDRTGEAFAAYSAANAELDRAYAPRFANIEAGIARVQRLAREFGAIDPARWTAPAGDNAPGHIFILGFYRAGTTLLGQILASHPRVVTLEEKPVMIEATGDFLDTPSGLARLAGLDEAGLARYRALYWQRVREMEPHSAGKIVADKLPLNSIALPVIARLFPGAKILFALRDPRDVVFSCFRRLLAVNRDTFEMLELERGARFYAAVMELAAHYRAALPLASLDVRNEDLAVDFAGQLGAICDFLGLDRADSMSRFAEQSKTRAIATPSAAQVARGINRDGIGQWRRYAEQMSQAMPLLVPWVRELGYPEL